MQCLFVAAGPAAHTEQGYGFGQNGTGSCCELNVQGDHQFNPSRMQAYELPGTTKNGRVGVAADYPQNSLHGISEP
jgi:hypothetical protein